jgi:pimeloyl-ACP methyl ester carboxylesterase
MVAAGWYLRSARVGPAGGRSREPEGDAARRAPRGALLACLLLVLSGSTGCFLFDRALVGVNRVGPETVDQQLNQNALTGLHPSASTLETLHYFGLTQRFEESPDEALVELHRAVAADPERGFLHALAELSYLRGKILRSRDHFLAAAAYAYLYLLGEEKLEPANPYDRRFRWACDLYNRGLREAFLAPDGGEMALEGGLRKLPVGSLAVTVDRTKFPVDDPEFHFLPADDYAVWGLSVRVRDSGLGAPLIARRAKPSGNDPLSRFRPDSISTPATIFLRVQGSLAELEHGVSATLELHSSFEPLDIDVDGRNVPLESDISAALALALDRSSIWGFSTRGFFHGDETRHDNRLFLSRPYQPGLVPVVFVHGTASNPANWAEMFNLLQAEKDIREHMQFWFFQYSTGSPIPVSAAVLRKQLRELITTVDPGGTDAALRRMVVIGHSQGGLLAKLMAVDGDIAWWKEMTGAPFEDFGFTPEQESILRSAIDFDAVPEVQRLIYICTPHRGSFLADKRFARAIAKMIALPGELTSISESLLQNAKRLPAGLEARIPTSLDNMRASSPFLQRLGRASLAPGVKAHSIIAIGDADPAHPEDANDGVVKYSSAHLTDVESELLVPTGHSCQSDPRTIAEVRRILLLHLREGAPACAAPEAPRAP